MKCCLGKLMAAALLLSSLPLSADIPVDASQYVSKAALKEHVEKNFVLFQDVKISGRDAQRAIKEAIDNATNAADEGCNITKKEKAAEWNLPGLGTFVVGIIGAGIGVVIGLSIKR